MELCRDVLVAIPVAETHMRQLREAGPGCNFRFRDGMTLSPSERERLHLEDFTETAPVSQADVDWADVILGDVEEHFLHGGEKLKWLQTSWAGVETYLKPGVLGKPGGGALHLWKHGADPGLGGYRRCIRQAMQGIGGQSSRGAQS